MLELYYFCIVFIFIDDRPVPGVNTADDIFIC